MIESKVFEKLWMLTNFINLYDDLGFQLGDGNSLVLSRTKELKAVWKYTYDQHFWTKPKNNKKGEGVLKDEFKLNFNQLSTDMNTIIIEFESRFSKI